MTDRPQKLNRIPFDEAIRRTMERFKATLEYLANPPERTPTPKQAEATRKQAWDAYKRLRRQTTATKGRRKKLTWLEQAYPEFRDAYNRYEDI